MINVITSFDLFVLQTFHKLRLDNRLLSRTSDVIRAYAVDENILTSLKIGMCVYK